MSKFEPGSWVWIQDEVMLFMRRSVSIHLMGLFVVGGEISARESAEGFRERRTRHSHD
jgi:hypothetical protein